MAKIIFRKLQDIIDIRLVGVPLRNMASVEVRAGEEIKLAISIPYFASVYNYQLKR